MAEQSHRPGDLPSWAAQQLAELLALREDSDRQGAENVDLLNALRERQSLLERLSALQRSIVERTALPEVLDAVARGVRDSLGADVVSVRLDDDEDPELARLVASVGAAQPLLARWRIARRSELISTGARRERRTVVSSSVDPEAARAEFAAEGVHSAISAPLAERGELVGTISAGFRSPGRRCGPRDEEALVAFAEHASLALNDARAAEETMHEAFHDSLTGLPNRDLFIDRLEHGLARLTRGGDSLAVLFCDLDGFKTVNDSLGHEAGDRLLAAAAARLAESLRPSDTVARFGGDEFAVLLEDLDEPDAATHAAARLLRALERPFEVAGRELFVGASIGIAAVSDSADLPAADELMRNADLAMYRAKARGRGRYEIFEPAMHEEVVHRMDLETGLKRAIERDELILHYQPIFDLPSGSIAGLEALVRWQHPTAGLLLPGAFIPLAEDSGQIRAIGRWVLREACRQLALWRAKYPAYPWLYVSVNLSGVQLREPDLVGEVDTALRVAQLDDHLLLEVTETVLMADTSAAAERLEALRALGARLAIDDFGTGYSSLEYLDRMPLDALKIAKPFVDRLGSGAGSDAIPQAITQLAEVFGLVVIAEGLEQPEQPEQLRELGCRFAQGNLLSLPLTAERADDLLLGAGLMGGESAPADEPERSSTSRSARHFS